IGIEIVGRSAAAGSGVEGAVANEFVFLEVVNERRVNAGDQFGGRGEAAADETALGLTDERLHLGVTRVGVGALDEDEAVFAELGGVIEFAVNGREAALGFDAAFVAEKRDEHV